MNPWTVRPGVWREGPAVDFGVVSRHASQVYLCLLEEDDQGRAEESARIPMRRCPAGIWHHRHEVCPDGQRYGYRAEGPWQISGRHCFNPSRFLLDPRAVRLAGTFRHSDALLNVPPGHPAYGLDSLPDMLRAVVDTGQKAVADTRPRIPWQDTVLYEVHVRGMTMTHPEVDIQHRGRYEGLCSPAIINHLKRLGVTTLQIMPVQTFIDEPFLAQAGRVNYWGYNPLAWYVPSARYAVSDAIPELQHTVEILHRHGLEVILDVVFNHTAESGLEGLTLSWRGLDNALHYQCDPGDVARLSNVSGCGNAVSLEDTHVLRLVVDCLRHWALMYGIDGFRFDLASVLCRQRGSFDARHPLWWVIRQDPLLCGLKWIVEPWDAAHDGYQLGRYPGGLMQLNDQFRDVVRRVIRGDHGQRAGLAKRLAGSWDIFTGTDQHLLTGVNPVASHDGFSLLDVVSYSHKHNLANGESNQDGQDENYSHNCGVEGFEASIDVQRMRYRRRSNAIMLMAFAQGVPMLSHGDEVGHTRHGNNNGWCMDDPAGWIDWQRPDDSFCRFVAAAFWWRQRLGVGHLGDLTLEGWRSVNHCLGFLRADGQPMQQADWNDWFPRDIIMEAGRGVWWLLCNFAGDQRVFSLPPGHRGCAVLDSANPDHPPDDVHQSVMKTFTVAAESVVLVIGSNVWADIGDVGGFASA